MTSVTVEKQHQKTLVLTSKPQETKGNQSVPLIKDTENGNCNQNIIHRKNRPNKNQTPLKSNSSRSNRNLEKTPYITTPPLPTIIQIPKENVPRIVCSCGQISVGNKIQEPGTNISPETANIETVTFQVSEMKIDNQHSSPPDKRLPLTSQQSVLEVDAGPVTPEIQQLQHIPPLSVPSTPYGSSGSMDSHGSSSSLSSIKSISESSSTSGIPPSSSQSSLCDSLPQKKRDFVILNTEEDEEKAVEYKLHLESEDIGIPDITVDIFSQISVGHGEFSALGNLQDQYHNVLILVTENLCCCRSTKHKSEALVIQILESNAKYSVVPIWTKKKKEFTNIPIALLPIKGLMYCNFHNEALSQGYTESVKRLILKGRSVCSP